MLMLPLQLHVMLDPKVEASPQVYVYENNLEALYFDLLAGKPYPLTLGVKAVVGPETLLAITLWLHRDLLIYYSTPSVVAGFTLAEKYPLWGLAHMERDLSRFIQFLRKYPVITQDNVVSAVTLIKRFIFDSFDDFDVLYDIELPGSFNIFDPFACVDTTGGGFYDLDGFDFFYPYF